MSITDSKNTRGKRPRFARTFSLILMVTLIAGMVAPAQDVRSSAARKGKSKMTVGQQFEQLATKHKGQMVVLPVLMHAIERQLQGIPAETEIDRAVRNALSRHPRITRGMLQTAVNNWKSVPAATKAKFVPAELRNLTPAQRPDVNLIKNAVRRSASGGNPNGIAPQRSGAYGSIFPTGSGGAISVVAQRADAHVGVLNPYIVQVRGQGECEGTPEVNGGKDFYIKATNVPNDTSKIKIHFLKPNDELKATVVPHKVTGPVSFGAPKHLHAKAPKLAGPYNGASYKLQIEADGGKSPKVWIRDPGMFECWKIPQITSFSPSSNYPGGKVELSGKYLLQFPNGLRTGWESQDSSVLKFVPIKRIGSDKAEVTVPQDLPPGTYRVAMFNEDLRLHQPKDFVVKAPLYQVNFTTIKCMDETDEEWPGDDEIVTIWQVGADGKKGHSGRKLTDTYEPFSDGKSKDYNAEDKKVYPVDVLDEDGKVVKSIPWRKVESRLMINTTLLEWDAGDAADAQKILDDLGDIARETGEASGDEDATFWTWLADVVLDIIGFFVVAFGGEPDVIDIKTLDWSAAKLQKLTAGKQQTTGSVDFHGDDGHYRLTYTINRSQP